MVPASKMVMMMMMTDEGDTDVEGDNRIITNPCITPIKHDIIGKKTSRIVTGSGPTYILG